MNMSTKNYMAFPKPHFKKRSKTKKAIPNYEEMFLYIAGLQGWRCLIALDLEEEAPIQELHHRLHNTEENRRRYPLFINSVFNLVGVNHAYHMKCSFWGEYSLIEADRIERYLEQNPEVLRIGYFENRQQLMNVIRKVA
jgi:hypothetical protein